MSGGGINLRLSLQGAEQVRAELDKIGPSGSKMARELDRAMRQPSAGLQALDAGARNLRGGVDDLAGRTGPLGAGLSSLGVVGLALAATLGAIAIAAVAVSNAMAEATASAADLTDTAERLGSGTEELQAWRYVADEAGTSVEALEANLEKLNGVMGAFKLGIGDGKLKPVFEELGITQAQLADVENANELMLLLADTLGQVQDRASQVKLARSLGVEESLPILRLGSERIRELSEEAANLGFVLDSETVKSLDETDRQLERTGQQMRIIRDTAVAPMASAFGDAATYVANLSVEFSQLESKAPRWIQLLNSLSRAMPGTGAVQRLGEMVIARVAPNRPRAPSGGGYDQDDPALLRQGMAVTAANGSQGGFELQGNTSGSSRGGGAGGVSQAERDRQRREQEAQRELERLSATEVTAQRDYIRAIFGRADTAASREEVSRQLRELDDREFEAQMVKVEATIRAGNLMTEEVQARLDALRDYRADVQAAAASEAAERADRERAEAMRAAEQQHVQITGELLSLASATARTSGERQEIELQLLELSQRRMRADLESAIQAEKEPEARARLVEALERLPALFDAQAADVRRRTAGPLAQWRDSQLQGPGEASEWLQGQALNALDGVNGGLIDAIRNADSAGDALERMGRVGVDALGRIADALLEVAIQRMVVQPLINGLFGGAEGSGSGGLLGSLFGNVVGNLFGPGYSLSKGSQKIVGAGKARGGVQGAAGWTPVGELGMEVVDLPVGSRVLDADRTQRTLLDLDNRLRMAAAGGAQRAPTVNLPISIVNRTSEPVTARTQKMPNGGLEVLLEPAVRSAVAKMGADGSLSDAHRLTPRPIRR